MIKQSALALLLFGTPAFATDNQFTTFPKSCYITEISPENVVTVDWDCVEKLDREFLDGKSPDIYGALSHVLKAVRENRDLSHNDIEN